MRYCLSLSSPELDHGGAAARKEVMKLDFFQLAAKRLDPDKSGKKRRKREIYFCTSEDVPGPATSDWTLPIPGGYAGQPVEVGVGRASLSLRHSI